MAKLYGKAHPIELKEFIWEMKKDKSLGFVYERGGRTCFKVTDALKVINDTGIVDYELTHSVLSNLHHTILCKEDVYDTVRGGPNRPYWSDKEKEDCKELYLKLPSGATHEEWRTLLLEPLDLLHQVRRHTQNACIHQMRKMGVKRYVSPGCGKKGSFQEQAKNTKELGFTLEEWESGITQWVVTHDACGRKKKFLSSPLSHYRGYSRWVCTYCTENSNALGSLYLTKVFFPEGSGNHSKPGKAGDSLEKVMRRMGQLGSTAIDKYWNDLPIWFIYEVEDKVAEKFGLYKTFPPELEGNGHTECYSTSIHNLIKDYMEQLVQEFLDAKSQIPSK